MGFGMKCADIVVAATVLSTAAFGSFGFGDTTGLAELVGSQCDECKCSSSSATFLECQHDSGDSDTDPCGLGSCIQNTIYYSSCPSKTNGSGCSLALSQGQIQAVQVLRDGAGGGCATTPTPWYPVPVGSDTNPCVPTLGLAKCSASSCGGTTLSSAFRYGRPICN